MRLACCDYEIVRLRLLQHQPHRFNVFFRVAPIPLGLQVAEVELFLQSRLDARHRPSDLAGHKSLTAPRGLVVKENPIAGKQAVTLAVIHCCPISISFRRSIRRPRMERRILVLWNLVYLAEHFRGTCLIEFRAHTRLANRFENSYRTQTGYVTRVFGNVEAYAHMRLSSEVVDLVRLNTVEQLYEIG